MRYIKVTLVVLIIMTAILVLIGSGNMTPILNFINALENCKSKKEDSIMLFASSLFAGFVSIYDIINETTH